MICITNRHLCNTDFIRKIRILAEIPQIEKIILREKDMEEEAYQRLAESCLAVCRQTGKPFAVNHFIRAARRLRVPDIQISFSQLRENQGNLLDFPSVGVSVHSPREAELAAELGATYVIAGHIYATDCKKGAPPRGLSYLREVCTSTSLPVYAIGGITPEHMKEVLETGAAGGCMMSGFMKA